MHILAVAGMDFGNELIRMAADPHFDASIHPSLILGLPRALGDIARAKGMTQVARDAGLSRESLYKALSGERNPGFDTILKVTRALGIELHAAPHPV